MGTRGPKERGVKKFKITYMHTIDVVVEAAHIENAAIIARNECLRHAEGVCKVFAIVEVHASESGK